MLIYELLPLFDGVRAIVDVTPEQVDLAHHLRVPANMIHEKCELDKAKKLDIGPGSLLLALVGDPPAHTDPESLTPVLVRLRPGARTVLLIGWPIEELPYHRILGPLVASHCQVVEAVPLDRASQHGAHCALLVERVDRLIPLRSYLASIDLDHDEPAALALDGLRPALRIANEYVLADLVTRPMRKRLREQDAQIAELNRKIAELNQLLAERTA